MPGINKKSLIVETKKPVPNSKPNEPKYLEPAAPHRHIDPFIVVQLDHGCRTPVQIVHRRTKLPLLKAPFNCLIDSGAVDANYMTSDIYYKIKSSNQILEREYNLHSASGKFIKILGNTRFSVNLGGQLYHNIKFVIIEEENYNNIVLGWPFMCKYEAVMNCKTRRIRFNKPDMRGDQNWSKLRSVCDKGVAPLAQQEITNSDKLIPKKTLARQDLPNLCDVLDYERVEKQINPIEPLAVRKPMKPMYQEPAAVSGPFSRHVSPVHDLDVGKLDSSPKLKCCRLNIKCTVNIECNGNALPFKG